MFLFQAMDKIRTSELGGYLNRVSAMVKLRRSLLLTLTCFLGLASLAQTTAKESQVENPSGKEVSSSNGNSTGKLKSFALSAEELGIAWEDWHKRVSHRLTRRLNKHTSAMTWGSVLARITITSDKKITAVVLNSSGSPRIPQGFLKAIESLNGSPGLLFPEKSQRDKIMFDYSFKRSLLSLPKHEWIRNDVELINQK